jgi:hypothetical protein
VNSVWRGNRAGIVVGSLDSEDLAPQHDAVVAGNRVDGTGAETAQRRADGFLDLLYGLGVVVVGGLDDNVRANRVTAAPRAGIAVTPNPALRVNFWPAERNRVIGNAVSGSGLYDLALVALPDADANCFSGNEFASSTPSALEAALPCDAVGTGDVATGALDLAAYLALEAPPSPAPRPSTVPSQPELPNARSRPAAPAVDLDVEVDASTIRLPAA